MKKRLLLLFILLVPFAQSIDCITYEDCPVRDCIGSARLCFEGSCISTECVSVQSEDIYYKSSAIGKTAINVDSVVSFLGRFILLAVVGFILAMFLAMLNIQKKLKIIITICIAIAVILFGIFLFAGKDIFLSILGNTEAWDSQNADSKIINIVNKEKFDVKERVLAGFSDDIMGGKEYILSSRLHESSAIILDLGLDKRLPDLGIDVMNSELRQKELNGHDVYIYESPLSETYAWKDDRLVYIISGEKEHTMEVADMFLNIDNNTAYVKEITPIRKPPADKGNPPQIRIKQPMQESYVSDNHVIFMISDNDSMIDIDTLKVKGLNGFVNATEDCIAARGIYNCSFIAELQQGKNSIEIDVSDVDGHRTSKTISFIFDTAAWHLNLIYPANNSYTNIPNIRFEISDYESGLNLSSFTLKGLNLSMDLCEKKGLSAECTFENANISDGSKKVLISGHDNAGNPNNVQFRFIFDRTKPIIKLTNKGFTVQDNIKLRNDSLFLDNKRYNLNNCYPIYAVYHCRYDRWISKISVMDEAGNSNTVENKLQRS